MAAERVDLDAAERVINRPHIIELREDGWTIMHPPACHPRLFGCEVNRAAGRDLEYTELRGTYECELNDDDEFAIGSPIEDSQGIDWAALVAELRELRQFERFIREHATSRHIRVLTLVENFDAGHRLPEEVESGAEHGGYGDHATCQTMPSAGPS